MIKFGKAVVKLRIPILILSIFLLIPSAIGYFNTRVNYDILTYLPEEIETMKGQDLLLDEFGTGAFSFCVVEGMDAKDISAMREQMEEVPHVKSVIWYDSLADISIPMEMLPDEIYDFFNNDEKDSTLLAVLYDTSMSADETMDAIEELRGVVKDQCYISGMSAVVTDIKNLSNKETPVYVLIAVVLAVIVLSLTMDSALAPIFFAQYRNGDCIQSGYQCFQGRDFLCDTGARGGLTAGCDDGLFHFPLAQLRRAAGAFSGR